MEKLRDDFPILAQKIYNKRLVYLDNAATTQKPKVVIDSIQNYYTKSNANIHRGVYKLSEYATKAYEASRDGIKQFINAKYREEIIFTHGTTESINLVAKSYVEPLLTPGDEVIISTMEHHANIIPWQVICNKVGAKLQVIPISEQGELNLPEYEKLLSERTKFVSITHISNVLGTINPIKKIIELAHKYNISVLIDGAQAVLHQSVDVQDLNCDFYVFSGHKMYGPTGIGILYGKKHLLDKMPPYQTGGDMIYDVSFDNVTYANLPYKFEAGTQNIAGAVGLHAAVNYIKNIGLKNIAYHEKNLLDYAMQRLKSYSDIKIFGPVKHRAAVISFIIAGIHPHDIATVLDREGIAVRVGHHCAMPLMKHLGLIATIRISVALYNRQEDIDCLILGLDKARDFFRGK